MNKACLKWWAGERVKQKFRRTEGPFQTEHIPSQRAEKSYNYIKLLPTPSAAFNLRKKEKQFDEIIIEWKEKITQ